MGPRLQVATLSRFPLPHGGQGPGASSRAGGPGEAGPTCPGREAHQGVEKGEDRRHWTLWRHVALPLLCAPSMQYVLVMPNC